MLQLDPAPLQSADSLVLHFCLHAQEGGQVQVERSGAAAWQRCVLTTLRTGNPQLLGMGVERAIRKGVKFVEFMLVNWDSGRRLLC